MIFNREKKRILKLAKQIETLEQNYFLLFMIFDNEQKLFFIIIFKQLKFEFDE